MSSELQSFIPGEEYGQPFRLTILVCVNESPRSFEQCELSEAYLVLEACKAQVNQMGLSRQVYVTTSGCLLGCRAPGTTVLLVDTLGKPRWYQGVTLKKLPALFKEIIQCIGS